MPGYNIASGFFVALLPPHPQHTKELIFCPIPHLHTGQVSIHHVRTPEIAAERLSTLLRANQTYFPVYLCIPVHTHPLANLPDEDLKTSPDTLGPQATVKVTELLTPWVPDIPQNPVYLAQYLSFTVFNPSLAVGILAHALVEYRDRAAEASKMFERLHTDTTNALKWALKEPNK